MTIRSFRLSNLPFVALLVLQLLKNNSNQWGVNAFQPSLCSVAWHKNAVADVTKGRCSVGVGVDVDVFRRRLPTTPLYASLNSNGGSDNSLSVLDPENGERGTGEDGQGGEVENAATNTVNERLLAELQEAKERETSSRSQFSKKLGMEAFKSSKTDEERRIAIEEARNLNGVNPLVAFAGAVFALAVAAGLWWLTIFLGGFFASHPVDTDIYAAQRVSQVIRNVAMGLASLASGFFGVTGVGILLLAGRVGYGVATGELDPTPIKKSKKDEFEMPDVWKLMTSSNKRRR